MERALPPPAKTAHSRCGVWNGEQAAFSLLRALTGHTAELIQVAWNKTGTRLLTAGLDGTARVWDVNRGAELFVRRQFSASNDPITGRLGHHHRR